MARTRWGFGLIGAILISLIEKPPCFLSTQQPLTLPLLVSPSNDSQLSTGVLAAPCPSALENVTFLSQSQRKDLSRVELPQQ